MLRSNLFQELERMMARTPVAGKSRISISPDSTTAFKVFTTALCLALLVGCAPTIGQHFRERAIERVAFETKCPRDQIELVPLDLPLDHPMRSGVHLGVKACGQQAVYVFTNQLGWVVNTESSTPNPPRN
jgi:hypothetical protein